MAALRAIVEGTARGTGEVFFQSLVSHLATAIELEHAFVAEFAGKRTRVRTLAYWAWFKNARFRVTLWISSQTLTGPALERVYTTPGCRAGASVPREPRVPQEFQPVSMRLTRQQLRGTFPDSTGVCTAQVPAVIQEELKQRQVVLPQAPPREEVASRPAVEVLDQTAGPHNPIG